MTPLRILTLTTLALTTTPLSPHAQEAPVTAYDLTYLDREGTALKLDLVRPATGEGPFPAVLVIHGGAWRAGDKASNRPLLAELARRGYVAVSPQYRFCPAHPFPAQVHDVKAAVRWLRNHAAEYHIDPERFGAMGFSAGGHLALMLGVTDPADGLEGDAPPDGPSSRVQAVVNFFGPTDLAAADIPDVSRPLVKDFLGATPAEAPEAAAQASPLTHLSKGDAPVLTYQGTRDPLVPHTQATALADAQTAKGVAGRVELLLGAGHGWGGAEMQRTLDGSFAFLDQHLRPARGR
jgi:acetyl esterase/lipase